MGKTRVTCVGQDKGQQLIFFWRGGGAGVEARGGKIQIRTNYITQCPRVMKKEKRNRDKNCTILKTIALSAPT